MKKRIIQNEIIKQITIPVRIVENGLCLRIHLASIDVKQGKKKEKWNVSISGATLVFEKEGEKKLKDYRVGVQNILEQILKM